MAVLYSVKCPRCGLEFKVPKGVFMSWDFSKPIPEELREETPFDCPDCGHTMCVKDENFRDNVIDIMHCD